jgi:nucleoside-triphosphatase
MALKILLQGPPKVGKTTVVERFVALLRANDIVVGGFLTTEQREHGRRVGFLLRDLEGAEAVIAHQDFATAVTVGRFGVDVPAFERVALPALVLAMSGGGVVIIDEIARMELASAEFVALLTKVIDQPLQLIATVHIHSHPVTDALLRRSDVQVVQVTEDCRDDLPEVLLAMVDLR